MKKIFSRVLIAFKTLWGIRTGVKVIDGSSSREQQDETAFAVVKKEKLFFPPSNISRRAPDDVFGIHISDKISSPDFIKNVSLQLFINGKIAASSKKEIPFEVKYNDFEDLSIDYLKYRIQCSKEGEKFLSIIVESDIPIAVNALSFKSLIYRTDNHILMRNLNEAVREYLNTTTKYKTIMLSAKEIQYAFVSNLFSSLQQRISQQNPKHQCDPNLGCPISVRTQTLCTRILYSLRFCLNYRKNNYFGGGSNPVHGRLMPADYFFAGENKETTMPLWDSAIFNVPKTKEAILTII